MKKKTALKDKKKTSKAINKKINNICSADESK
jgi:hypothetical protein